MQRIQHVYCVQNPRSHVQGKSNNSISLRPPPKLWCFHQREHTEPDYDGLGFFLRTSVRLEIDILVDNRTQRRRGGGGVLPFRNLESYHTVRLKRNKMRAKTTEKLSFVLTTGASTWGCKRKAQNGGFNLSRGLFVFVIFCRTTTELCYSSPVHENKWKMKRNWRCDSKITEICFALCVDRKYKLELEQMMVRVESQPTLFQKQGQVHWDSTRVTPDRENWNWDERRR